MSRERFPFPWHSGVAKREDSKDRRTAVAAGLVMAFAMAGPFGCQREEGPAERAGKQVDQAVDSAGKQVEKAGEKIQDAARGAGK